MSYVENNVVNRELVIIGAGISGLTLATKMQNEGWSVAVIDKARGTGGRMSSKRIVIDEDSGEHISFDLGCSDFSAYSSEFKEQLQLWIAQGHVECIHTDGQRRYTSVPRSSSLTRSMANRITTRFQTRVTRISKVNDRWHCYEQTPEGELSLVSVSDYLVLAIPPAQAAALLDNDNPYKERLDSISIESQWVAMFILDDEIDLDFSPSQLQKHGISMTRCESNKPGRVVIEGMSVWLVHMNNEWTQSHINLGKEEVSDLIGKQLELLAERSLAVRNSFCHRWLYAQVTEPMLAECGTLKLDSGLYACGDWLVDEADIEAAQSEGVERAYLSALNLSKSVLFSLHNSKTANVV
jgi:predicted NAD/FAD-dependent oxidoreductase